MIIKYKKLVPDAVEPVRAHHGDAGFDLVATTRNYDYYGNVVYGTGLTFEIPEGNVGLLFPRSSNSKKGLVLANSVGVIDSGYRGEVILKFRRTTHGGGEYDVGDKVGQLVVVPVPYAVMQEVQELSVTDRNADGFGSTGK